MSADIEASLRSDVSFCVRSIHVRFFGRLNRIGKEVCMTAVSCGEKENSPLD